jgi:hypothetical protein
MRRMLALPKTQSVDIAKLKRQREQLVAAHKSTAIIDRKLTIAVAAQIRAEVRAEASQ